MKPIIAFNIKSDFKNLPSRTEFLTWVNHALAGVSADIGLIIKDATITIAVVDKVEMQRLNTHYRHKANPTNTLSFPYTVPTAEYPQLVGDIALCAPTIKQEATEQGKLEKAHWAHLTVHSVLHLCGYDHIETDKAEQMEALECKLLEELGFESPHDISSIGDKN